MKEAQSDLVNVFFLLLLSFFVFFFPGLSALPHCSAHPCEITCGHTVLPAVQAFQARLGFADLMVCFIYIHIYQK